MTLHEWIWGTRLDVCPYIRCWGVPIPMGIYNRLPQWFRDRQLRAFQRRRQLEKRDP